VSKPPLDTLDTSGYRHFRKKRIDKKDITTMTIPMQAEGKKPAP